jgi:hypothetical protein
MADEQPIGEMNEENLLVVSEIFWPTGDWVTQKKIYYDETNKRKFYKVDAFSKIKNIVWEYEGPNHYNDVWKIRRDEERKSYFVKNEFTFLRWPYYLQLTEDVAEFIFKKNFTSDKYHKAIKVVYGASSQMEILAPGIHTSKNTPANFIGQGVKRFFLELDLYPSSVKAQIAESLRRYVKHVRDSSLVVGDELQFQELLNTEISEHELKVFFSREK